MYDEKKPLNIIEELGKILWIGRGISADHRNFINTGIATKCFINYSDRVF